MTSSGVHRTHCCILHGCKYGDNDCPVYTGIIKQDHPCEDCSYDGLKNMDEVIKVKNRELPTCNNCGHIVRNKK